MKNTKVSNLKEGIKNQFIISTKEGEYFQSYNSVIAFRKNDGSVILDETYWDYSLTTSKYRNLFLGEIKKDTIRKLDKGIYKLGNLN